MKKNLIQFLEKMQQILAECKPRVEPLLKQGLVLVKQLYAELKQHARDLVLQLVTVYQGVKLKIQAKFEVLWEVSTEATINLLAKSLALKNQIALFIQLYGPLLDKRARVLAVQTQKWTIYRYQQGVVLIGKLFIWASSQIQKLRTVDYRRLSQECCIKAHNCYYLCKQQPWKQHWLNLIRDLKALRQIDTRKVFVCLLCSLYGVTSWSDVPDEIKVLIEQKRPKEAYELGLKHPELMGDPLFDYFFGVAAVEAGRASYGVLALERVLLSNPNDDLARLELARAYFTLGDYQRAREEFETVKKSRPPAGVVSTINIYLDAIDRKEGEYKVQYGLYGELGIGYNNNVNTAAAINNIILPYFGPVQLSATSQPQSSVFSYTLVGATVNAPITANTHAFANVNNSTQRYSQVNGYDLNVSNATVGVKTVDGANEYKAVGFGSLAKLDQVPVPDTLGAGVEYVRHLNSTQSVLVGGGTSSLAYGSQYGAYDSNLSVATVGYRQTFPTTKWSPVVDVMANYASQTNTSNRPDLGRKITGGNIQLSMIPTEKLGISVGAGYAHSNYGAPDLLFLTNRADNLVSGNAVVQYKLTKELSARAEFTYFNNQSNINLYGYDQWTGALKLRYEWNSN
jgi:tetratricopeptide (TPR) repeat protein